MSKSILSNINSHTVDKIIKKVLTKTMIELKQEKEEIKL